MTRRPSPLLPIVLLLGLAACPAPEPVQDPCVPASGERSLDAWGGDERVDLEATGWFRREQLCERWWLVSPDGHPFYSFGVNTVGPWGSRNRDTGEYAYRETVEALYPDLDSWASTAAERLRSWELNTAGSWSHWELFTDKLPFTVNLGLAGDDWQSGDVADYFSPEWEAEVARLVEEIVVPASGEAGLVGYFLDNELRWGPDWRGLSTLLQDYLGFGADTAGKAAAVDHLLQELGSLEAVNAFLGSDHIDRDALLNQSGDWESLDHDAIEAAELNQSFMEAVAERYFAYGVAAVRAADPAHLVLGNREVSVTTPPAIFDIQAPHVDLLSINNYVFLDGVADAAMNLTGALDPSRGFAALHQRIDLPMLITEFGFRADDVGLPNSWPPIYPTMATQEERAQAFEDYAMDKQSVPWILGYHWFAWVDQPAAGRFDGENNNWGLVNEQDQPYPVLTDRMGQVNARIAAQLMVPGP